MTNPQYNVWKKLVDDHILDFLPSTDTNAHTLKESMEYSLKAGGKRLRPVLLIAAADFCGLDAREALPYACALEFVHTSSLIHDDLPCMDDDDLRRGIPTNHKVYGEAMATLAGDGLLLASFEAMTKDCQLYLDDPEKMRRRIRAMNTIVKGSGVRGMVQGQSCDVEIEGKECSSALLDFIHLNKTAALITASVKAGGYLAGADAKTIADLTAYGEAIGLAFQIADDLLDVYGTEEEMGKRVHKDAELSKATYPAVYGIEASKARLAELTERALAIMAPYYDNAQFFNDLARDLMTRTN